MALLTNILAPYRIPVFRSLADTPGWQLRVFTNAATEPDRSWRVDAGGLDVEQVPSLSWARGDRALHLPWGLPAALLRFRPDVVVSAELGARTLLAWLHTRLRGVPLVAWIETTPLRASAGGRLRRHLGPWLLQRADAVLGPGRAARCVALDWGVPEERIFDAPNAHDVETVARRLAALDPEAAARDLRAKLAARPQVALVAGRLFPIKGVAELLDAWSRLPAALRRDWTLLFLGDGPLERAVSRARDRHPPGEIVHVPAVQPEEVVPFYAAADLLVFPSLGDVWGFAVNEAMACGLPVLCSTRAGCADELAIPGETGWRADPLDPDAFAAALAAALSCDERRRLGERARREVERFTPELTAHGIRHAVRHALEDEEPEVLPI